MYRYGHARQQSINKRTRNARTSHGIQWVGIFIGRRHITPAMVGGEQRLHRHSVGWGKRDEPLAEQNPGNLRRIFAVVHRDSAVRADDNLAHGLQIQLHNKGAVGKAWLHGQVGRRESAHTTSSIDSMKHSSRGVSTVGLDTTSCRIFSTPVRISTSSYESDLLAVATSTLPWPLNLAAARAKVNTPATPLFASDEPCVAAARTTAMLLELGVLFITVVVCAPM